MTFGALGTVSDPSLSVQKGVVSMILLFSFGYSLGWAPLPYLISAETPAPSLKEHTCAFGYTVKLVMEYGHPFPIGRFMADHLAEPGS